MTQSEISRRERKKDETRERISRAAIDLFQEKGFEATTVDEIAARADVAKGTFFNYFPRKEAALCAFAEDETERLSRWADARLAEPDDFRAKVLDLVSTGARLYESNRDVKGRMLIEMLRGPVSLLEQVDGRAQATVRRFIEAGIATGQIRAGVDAERATSLLRGVFFHTVLHWLFRPQVYELESELRARIALLLDGLAPDGDRPGSTTHPTAPAGSPSPASTR